MADETIRVVQLNDNEWPGSQFGITSTKMNT